jgi:endonuclease G
MLIDEFKDGDLVATARRFVQQKKDIEDAYQKATTGHVDKVESEDRIRKYWNREREHWAEDLTKISPMQHPELGIERVLGMQNDLLSIEFLEGGLDAARSVGMISVAGSDFGTGFLIGEGLLITNHHVIDGPETAAMSVLDLNYEANRIGLPKPVETFALEPDRFFLTDKPYDFTIVAVSEHSANGRSIEEFGYHPLIGQEGKILIGQPVNVIQHPKGRMKSICVHDSRFMYLQNGGEVDPYCWYSSDTEPGSSGSPVFNNRWEVVALHHKAIPKTDEAGRLLDRNNRQISKERAERQPEDVVWVANEGIRASRLVRGIKAAELSPAFASERQALLALWARPKGRSEGLESARRPTEQAEGPSARPGAGSATAVQVPAQPGVPVTITITVQVNSG